MAIALATSSRAMKRDGRPKIGKTQPCRAGKTDVRYCRLMNATLEHDRHVQTAWSFPAGATMVVYYTRKSEPYLVWTICPYCGASIVPIAVRKKYPAQEKRA